MKKAVLRFSLSMGLLICVVSLPAQKVVFTPEDLEPDIPQGAAVGSIGEWMIIAGGMGVDGEESDRIRIFSGLKEVGTSETLPAPLAFPAVVSTEEAIFLVGGVSGREPVDSVYVLRRGEESLEVSELPSLPQALCLSGAAVMDGYLYVAGGIGAGGVVPSQTPVFRIILNDFSSEWEFIPAPPGPGRVWPAVAGFYGELHLMGGATVTLDDSGSIWAHPVDEAWGYRSIPLDGTKATGWRSLTPIPVKLAGATPLPTGQTHVLLIGGTDEPVRLEGGILPAPTWARNEVWIYHNVTNTWIRDGELTSAIVGAYAFPWEGEQVVAGTGLSDQEGSNMYTVILERRVKKMGAIDFAVMLIYFGFMAWIGFYFARKQNSSEEFALGNRNVKWWAAGVSMFATGASSISFMAIPAQAFRTNLVWFAPTLFIIPLAFLQAYVIYPLLRRLNLTSTYEYLERRYHPALRLVASAQMICFQLIGRMSVVMLLPSLAISAVTGLPVLTSVLLMGILTTIYTTLGGFEAVVWTDFCQGVLMLFGGFLMIFLAITGLPGGLGEFLEIGRTYDKFNLVIWDWDYTMPVIWIFGITLLLQNLAFAADQPVVQRVYATPLKDMRKLAGMFAFCSVAIALIASFSGLAMFAYFHAHPELLDPAMSNDQVVPLYIVQRLPAGIAGLIIAALFAASMSTLSSSMNSVATVLCEDFYRKLFPQAIDRSRLRFMKLTSFGVGAFGTAAAAYMGTLNIQSMFETWNIIVALLGGGFIGIYILGMFTRRTNSLGAVVGALASILATVLVKEFSPLHWTFYGPVAVLTCLIVGYLVSILSGGNVKPLPGLTVFDLRQKHREHPLGVGNG